MPFAIAAYNAGENALKKWMAKYNDDDLVEFIENIPYKETSLYVKRVLKSYWRYRTINGLPVEASQIARTGKIGFTFYLVLIIYNADATGFIQ